MRKALFFSLLLVVSASLVAQELVAFGNGKLYGYKTKQGKIVIPTAGKQP